MVIAGFVLAVLALRAFSTTEIVVEWSTASEMDTAGFHLYRSSTEDGEYTRITDGLIPAADDPLTGGAYNYTDTNVEAGRTYFYQLEEVEMSGNTSTHGPIPVEATRGGWLEGLTALVLIVMGFGGLRDVRKPAVTSPPTQPDAC
jgi:hypothetical protein